MFFLFMFQPDRMYYWAHSEPILQTLEIIPAKLSTPLWPPENFEQGNGDTSPPKGLEGKIPQFYYTF